MPRQSSSSSASNSNAALQAPDLTYEAALQQLEGLVQRMDSGQMPLEELLGAYTQGAQLLAHCRAKLDAVEQQIKRIDGKALD